MTELAGFIVDRLKPYLKRYEEEKQFKRWMDSLMQEINQITVDFETRSTIISGSCFVRFMDCYHVADKMVRFWTEFQLEDSRESFQPEAIAARCIEYLEENGVGVDGQRTAIHDYFLKLYLTITHFVENIIKETNLPFQLTLARAAENNIAKLQADQAEKILVRLEAMERQRLTSSDAGQAVEIEDSPIRLKTAEDTKIVIGSKDEIPNAGLRIERSGVECEAAKNCEIVIGVKRNG